MRNRLEDSQEERASVFLGSKVIPQEMCFVPSPPPPPPLPPPSFVLVAGSERGTKKRRKKREGIKECKQDDVRDGWRDGWRSSSLSACMCVRMVCAHLSVFIRLYCRERGDALMDEEHPLPFQQWKCLKHPGPRDGPCHSLPSW